MLHEVDIVIASSGAPHYILKREDMQRVIAQRKNKPMFLIDIAVPRNIDPAVNEIEGVFLYDVDDLEGVVNANLQERGKQAEQAEAIVAQEVEQMMARLQDRRGHADHRQPAGAAGRDPRGRSRADAAAHAGAH